MSIPRVGPAEAARRARWHRHLAAIAQTDAERVEAEAMAVAYQSQAIAGAVEVGKNADEGRDF